MNIEDWYRRYGPMVLRRCRTMLRHEAQAMDAMQDVFVRLMRHEHRLHDEAPAALLLKMATHECLNRIAAEKRAPLDGDDAVLQQIAAATGNEESRLNARMVLDRLFRRERESTRLIAVLHLVDGMTLEEVAAETGLSVSGVRKRLRELKARLERMNMVEHV